MGDESSEKSADIKSPEGDVDWHVYILETVSGKLYTGIALDVNRRIRDHAGPRGAKFVKANGGVKALVGSFFLGSKSRALKAEIIIKKMSRKQKFQCAVRGLDMGLIV